AVIVGATVYVLSLRFGLTRGPATVVGMITIASLRLGAIAWNWSLPVYTFADERAPPKRDKD
ncbi:MAG: hypothetical protein M0P19_00475, partial [Nevskia sp.]|nr:hypothetical protein [Nevskia sp.]